jgi:hypothetical protein
MKVLLAVSIMYACQAAYAGTLTLNTGTQLHVVMETTINTKKNAAGDPFRARLVLPVWQNQSELLPVGTLVEGTIASMKEPGRATGRAQMQLRPEKLILPDGRDLVLAASIEGLNTADDTKFDPKEGTVTAPGKDGINKGATAAGTVMGAGVGAAVGGGMGAAVGAGAVATVAVLHQVFKRGKDAEIPAGSELVLELSRPLSLSDMKEVPNQKAEGNGAGSKEAQTAAPAPVVQPARAADHQK